MEINIKCPFLYVREINETKTSATKKTDFPLDCYRGGYLLKIEPGGVANDCLIFGKFQSSVAFKSVTYKSVAYKSVAYKKKRVYIFWKLGGIILNKH